jgi:hypothetical protein
MTPLWVLDETREQRAKAPVPLVTEKPLLGVLRCLDAGVLCRGALATKYAAAVSAISACMASADGIRK